MKIDLIITIKQVVEEKENEIYELLGGHVNKLIKHGQSSILDALGF